jgi:transposase
VGGQRDPKQLARLRDPRIVASRETIQKSLEGNWQEELLFDLKMTLESYDHFQGQIAAYDEQTVKNSKRSPPKRVSLSKPCLRYGTGPAANGQA